MNFNFCFLQATSRLYCCSLWPAQRYWFPDLQCACPSRRSSWRCLNSCLWTFLASGWACSRLAQSTHWRCLDLPSRIESETWTLTVLLVLVARGHFAWILVLHFSCMWQLLLLLDSKTVLETFAHVTNAQKLKKVVFSITYWFCFISMCIYFDFKMIKMIDEITEKLNCK